VSTSTLRPRSVSEIFDASSQLVRRHFGPLALLAAVLAIPGLVFGIINLQLFPELASIPTDPSEPAAVFPSAAFALYIPLGMLALCWIFVMLGALVIGASEGYLHGRIDAGAAVHRALARPGRLIGGNLLAYLVTALPILLAAAISGIAVPMVARGGGAGAGLVALAGLLAFAGIVWLFIALPRYALVTPIVALEEVGAVASLGRARELTGGHKLRIFLVLFLFFVIFWVVTVTVTLGLLALLRNPLLASAISNLFYIPFYAVLAALLTVIYYDLRIRKEGFDIEMMAGGL
jgi:hypothetical protein